jgi:catechol 2,3-dioxygenase-like lactoylglutathione lyase family enzyme
MLSFGPGVAIGVRSYKDAIKFYEETLGLTLHKYGDKESEFRCGGTPVFIEDNEKEQVTWIEFKSDNVEELKTRLEKAGCLLTKTHLDNSYLVVDPYGMRFHIYQ